MVENLITFFLTFSTVTWLSFSKKIAINEISSFFPHCICNLTFLQFFLELVPEKECYCSSHTLVIYLKVPPLGNSCISFKILIPRTHWALKRQRFCIFVTIRSSRESLHYLAAFVKSKLPYLLHDLLCKMFPIHFFYEFNSLLNFDAKLWTGFPTFVTLH